MFRSLWILFFVTAVSVSFLCGCAGNYSEEALARARAFALERTRSVPEIARNHIRYTPPEVQTADIFLHEGVTPTDYAHLPRLEGRKKNVMKDFLCINFVWTFPGADYSIVVLGKGLRDFSFWEGTRVILKKHVPAREKYEAARSASIGYVFNNMLTLSTAERNRVRFSEAEVLETCFALDVFSEPFHRKGGPDAWKEYLAELKARPERVQYSLVWKADQKDRWIVISGFGLDKEMDPDREKALYAWRPVTGMVISGERLKKYTLGKVDTYAILPEQKNSPEEKMSKK